MRAARRDGLPILGTCAGLIALADEILDGDPTLVGGLDIGVRRNAFGRQVASFETLLAIDGIGQRPVEALFIRAPVSSASAKACAFTQPTEGGRWPSATARCSASAFIRS